MDIENYHAHLYYTADQLTKAKELGHYVATKFDLQLGRFHERPVGPHPSWSCQLTIEPEKFGEVVQYLLVEHGDIDVFIHANTGRDLEDHTRHVMWIGKSYELKTSMFEF